MSSSIGWRDEGLKVSEGAATMLRNEVAIDNRLNTLREVALTLLREVESLWISQPVNAEHSVRLQDEVRRFEIDLIRSALGRTGGNQTRAAQLLGVKITTLNTKIMRYKISPIGYESGVTTERYEEETAA